jgi:hypothetical protein
MHNEMQQLLALSEELTKTNDPDERDRIMEEISYLEEFIEAVEEDEYKAMHHSGRNKFGEL